MNKQIIAVLAATGLMCFAGFASAAAKEVTGPSNRISVADCSMLSEPVTIGASAKVIAAYNCSEITNVVSVGTCHSGGSRSPLACNSVQNQAAIDAAVVAGQPAVAPVYPAGCNQADGTGTSTVVDFKAFFATSAGGAMSEQSLGGKCVTGKVAGLKAFGS